MAPADPQFARSEILRIFNHDEVYLFLGVAITTIGLLAGFFSLLRRRFDPLLFWFALFAILYGLRLDLNYQLLWGLQLRPLLLQRIALSTQFLIPIPAVLFFRALDLFGARGRVLSKIVWRVAIGVSLVAFAVGMHYNVQHLNNVIVSVALAAITVLLMRIPAETQDLILMRCGLLLFVVCGVFDNVSSLVGHFYNIEPFSFLILLGTLGVVAGRRAYAKEQKLTVLQKELEIAQQIQLSILPASFPTVKGFRVASRYLPMTDVAGDFYDFLLASEYEVGILIADVSGHGIPAALIASMVKVAASSQRTNADRPSDLLLGINETLFGNTQRQFVTAGYVYLNSTSQEFRYSSAGHPPMLLLRDGEVTEILENGIPLALFEAATYTTLAGPIRGGDRLVLYTDGLLEAANSHQEEFGPERLYALIRESGHRSHTEAADHIVSAIQRWSPEQGDDLTVIVCDYGA